jgi:ADP-heptose:LPS heptosyltransferase
MVDPRYVELLDLVEGIDRCIPFDPRDLTRGVHAWSVLGELRRTRYDAVIDLQAS